VIPEVSAGADAEICLGTGSSLQASGAVTYVWNQMPGLSCYTCDNPIATPDSATVYQVTGTNIHGCTDVDSINILVIKPVQLLNSGPDTVCLGKSTNLVVAGAFAYQWSPSAGLSSTNIPNPIATPQSTTVYTVVGTDHKNCFTDTAYIPVKVYPVPTVDAGPDKTINVGQMTDLVPVISPDVTTVTWSPTGSIFRNHYPAITVKPRETTEYQVVVTNDGGCRSRDNIVIHVICNGANVFIPNTFSPNGDGMNDVFYPRGTGLFSIKSARVYNRWGEIVYERNNFQSNDVNAGWDGTYKGVKLNPDVYVYTIDILCDNNTVLPFKGNIALIK
jgi:gliding motility-associated-like protein